MAKAVMFASVSILFGYWLGASLPGGKRLRCENFGFLVVLTKVEIIDFSFT